MQIEQSGSEDNDVTVTLTGRVSFVQTTNLFKAGQIIAFLNASNNPLPSTIVPDSYSHSNLTFPTGSAKKSPREALSESGAVTNPQKIAALGLYLIEKDGSPNFTIGAIKDSLKRAGEPLPGNFSRDLREATKAGYIMESETQTGEYELTDKGLSLVKSGFSEGVRTKNSKPTKRTANSGKQLRKNKSLRAEIADMEIATISTQYGAYPYKGTQWLRILWIAGYADEHGVAEISPAEIEYISDKLRDSIPARNFTASTETPVQKGYLRPLRDGVTKILQGGIDHLKEILVEIT